MNNVIKGIYKITNPKGKVYIGQSINIIKRFSSYKRLIKRSIGQKLYNSFLKYGVENHKFEIIHELPIDTEQCILDTYEILYISQFKECGVEMLNLTNGGEGSTGYKHNEESKKKMKKSKEGKYLGSNNPNFGKGLFGENNGMYGIKRPEVGIKAKEYSSKIVYQYDLNNILKKEWVSVSEAAASLNLKIANISACALNKPNYKTAGGFIWKYNKKENE